MKLEKVTVAIRPRTPWEAVDLGFAMVRAWWRPLLSAWLVTVLPFWILGLTLLYRWPVISILVLWWLRPLFDRVPLYYLSRALFGAPPGLRETLRAGLRPGWSFALAYLTIFRLDVARSFNLPVWQLEGLRGRARGQRLRVLNFNSRGTAISLGLACLLLEFCLLFGALALVSLLAPETMNIPWREIFESWWSPQGALGAHLLFGGAWFFAFTMVELGYVAAGFSLYINRRVELEGWDIELVFRKLAQRVAEKNRRDRRRQRGRVGRGAGVSGLVALLLCLSMSARAQDPAPAPGDGDADPAALIEEVLSRPEFETERTFKKWQRKSPTATREREERVLPDSVGDVLTAIVDVMAAFLEVFLWLAFAVAFVGLLLYFSKESRASKPPPQGEPEKVPEVLFGLDVREESLPRDLGAAALSLLGEGKVTEALSLLYRGTLARWLQGGTVTVEASWTEADCLAQAQPRMTPERFEVFRRLTKYWCRSAYGRRPPPVADLEALCRQWRQVFEGEAS